MVDLNTFMKSKTVSSGRTKTLLNFTDKTYPKAYKILIQLRAEGYDLKALVPALLREALKGEGVLEDKEKTENIEEDSAVEPAEAVKE